MVYENEYHPVPEQGGSFQGKAGAVTARKLFSGLFRWERCESRSKVPSLEVQPSKPRASQSLPSVCSLTAGLFFSTNQNSLTQATDTSNIRLVFAAVKETILQNALKDSGIL